MSLQFGYRHLVIVAIFCAKIPVYLKGFSGEGVRLLVAESILSGLSYKWMNLSWMNCNLDY